MLRDNGVIIDADADAQPNGDDGCWSIVPDRLDPSDVPTTISGVLQARLDQLGADERAVLQHAAVMGRTFWDDAVAAMMGRPIPARAIATAVQRELVYPREHSSFDGCQEYVFKHALLREVAYETVLLRDRAALHARAAEWLTARAGDRVDEYLDTIANHHRRAAQHAEAAGWLFPRRLGRVRAWPRPGRPRQTAAPPRTSGRWPTCRYRSRRSSCSARSNAGEAIPTPPSRRCTPRSTASTPTITCRAEALYLLAEVAFDRASEAAEIALLQQAEQLVCGERSLVRCRIAVGLAWWETRYGDLAKAEQHGRRRVGVGRRTAERPDALANPWRARPDRGDA